MSDTPTPNRLIYDPDSDEFMTLEEIEQTFYPHQVDESESIIPPYIQHNDPGDETDVR